jgi:hypothetical protein
MIQRIQSIWLLLASVCALASYKLPFYSGNHPKGPGYELNSSANLLLVTVTALTGILALFLIFMYKQRVLQMRLCLLGIVLEAALIFLYYREVQQFTTGTLALTSILQTFIIVFFFLAARAINKDEKMVKESDRLR